MNNVEVLEIYEIIKKKLEQRDADIWKALTTRIDTINERTKKHTIDIREIWKKLKQSSTNSSS